MTYAAGNNHQEVCVTLIAGSADVRAQVGAEEVPMGAKGTGREQAMFLFFCFVDWKIHVVALEVLLNDLNFIYLVFESLACRCKSLQY